MGRIVTSRGRSGRQVTSLSRMVERVVTAMGGRSSRVVHGRNALAAITGIGAATLIIFAGGHSSASPPLGEDVTGAASAILTMGGAGTGGHLAPVLGTAGTVLALTGEAGGATYSSVTGTGAATLSGFSGEGVATLGGVGASTLVLEAAGVGTFISPVAGAASGALALTAAAAGTFFPMVVGAGSKTLLLTGAASGTAASGTTNAPASVLTPASGSDLTAVWNLRNPSATGPRYVLSNGTWAGSVDAYLTSLGIVSGGGGTYLLWNIGSATKTLENYDMTGAPDLYITGTGSANLNDVPFDGDVIFPATGPGSINADTNTTLVVTFNYSTFDGGGWFMGAGKVVENYCRHKNQLQTICGVSYNGLAIAQVEIRNPLVTGGGVHAPDLSHMELMQMKGRPEGSYFIADGVMYDPIDGQKTTTSQAFYTALWSIGPFPATISNSIYLGMPAIDANQLAPNRTNSVLAYETGSSPVFINCVMEPGHLGYMNNQSAGGVPYPGRDGGGNRTLANVPLTAADLR